MKETSLVDYLNFAHVVDEGIIINKDGALMCAFEGRGPDLQSASDAELAALSSTVNRMALNLDDGWMLHVDEVRAQSVSYPALGDFPDSVSRLIDEERRQQYEAEGSHFENTLIFTFVWKFPKPTVNTARHWFVKGLAREEDAQNLQDLMVFFKEKVSRAEGLLAMHFWLKPLNSADFVKHLNFCISGDFNSVRLPPEGLFLDVALGRHDVVGGYCPKVGNQHVVVLSLTDYANMDTRPALLEAVGSYPLVYRWSNRFVFLGEKTAEREIKKYRAQWSNKVKGLWGIIRESFGMLVTRFNLDAIDMTQQTDDALQVNTSGAARFGYYTSSVVFMHENLNVLNSATVAIARYMEQSGFGVVKEDVNAMDAWMGSIPGHGSCNIRRLFCHSVHLAHFMPLNTTWSGAMCAHTNSLLPKNAPPVFYAATTGNTPYRFNMDVSDVGNQMVLGPIGSGKSTWVAFLVAQFLRYKEAQVFIFDNDSSHQGLTEALSGQHYKIHPDAKLSFCPLANLSSDMHRLRAMEWVEQLILLQGLVLSPERHDAIYNAIMSMAHEKNDTEAHDRNLTVLRSRIQDDELRAALKYYTIDGTMPMMDALEDGLHLNSHINTFEMEWLLKQEPSIQVPVLQYLFNHVEDCGNAHRPTLVVFEEAWSYLKHPLFSAKITKWLKTWRKKNIRAVFLTQTLADLYDPTTKTLTATTNSIVTDCHTHIFLPNTTMEEEGLSLYQKLGLTLKQCEIISKVAIPKKHYYVKTKEGQRLIELGFSEKNAMSLCFVGLTLQKGEALMACKEAHGAMWVYHWLKAQGFPEWAEYWLNEEKKRC
jgi:type IV secretion system protein TrbE